MLPGGLRRGPSPPPAGRLVFRPTARRCRWCRPCRRRPWWPGRSRSRSSWPRCRWPWPTSWWWRPTSWPRSVVFAVFLAAVDAEPAVFLAAVPVGLGRLLGLRGRGPRLRGGLLRRGRGLLGGLLLTDPGDQVLAAGGQVGVGAVEVGDGLGELGQVGVQTGLRLGRQRLHLGLELGDHRLDPRLGGPGVLGEAVDAGGDDRLGLLAQGLRARGPPWRSGSAPRSRSCGRGRPRGHRRRRRRTAGGWRRS